MARKVFFSFHYDKDSWRVGQVRNAWLIGDHEAQPFLDKARWEEVEAKGETAVQSWIDNAMLGTSVTVVLIGAETAGRKWVKYEIRKSHTDDKGMIGVYIHNLKNQHQQTDSKGSNPFDNFSIEQGGQKTSLSSIYPTYDWVNDNGRLYLPDWVEKAAKAAGR